MLCSRDPTMMMRLQISTVGPICRTMIRFNALKTKKRPLSSAASSGGSGPFRFIPPPTWSIASLGLDRNHSPVSSEELQTLCKRALLDPRLWSNEETDALRQDLGNMLHMVHKVRDDARIEELANDMMAEIGSDPSFSYYDVPRIVKEAPTREDDYSSSELAADAQNVLESFLRPSMKQHGVHHYFEIVTGRGSVVSTKGGVISSDTRKT